MALPVNGSTYLIPAYYSFYRRRKDERLSWLSWLTYSGWLTHISGHPSAAGRAQDRESSPARDRRSTTVPHLCILLIHRFTRYGINFGHFPSLRVIPVTAPRLLVHRCYVYLAVSIYSSSVEV